MAPKTNRKELSDSTKDQVIGMNMAGLSGQKVTDKLGLVKSTVNRIIKRYEISGSVKNKPRRKRGKTAHAP